jgi:hypothetical protein
MRFHWIGPAAALALTAGCSGNVDPLLTTDSTGAAGSTASPGEEFLSVSPKASSSGTGAAGASTEQFYVAVKRSALGQRYFLSAYLTQLFPGAVSSGAARSLGTRVVSFKVQNGKLYVFDASDIHKDSDTFDPAVLVDGYPIVAESALNMPAGSSAADYVVFDPAAGMNKFGVLGDAFAAPGSAVPFEVQVSYLQRFRAIADGVTWEQVFTGFSTQPINDGAGGENNVLRASGTLGLALRKYSEGKGYQPVAVPDQGEYFFRADPIQIPNSGQFAQPASRWNVYKGMKPIKWVISDHVAKLASDPQYKQYDVQGALKAAIESWNDVFGFQVLQASLATAGQSFGDDDVNYVLWDEDPTFGAAFANWRTNPNTGEIRGASVYMNATWLAYADQYFQDDPAKAAQLAGKPQPRSLSISWSGMSSRSLCTLWGAQFRGEDVAGAHLAQRLAASAAMTKKQKVEAYLTHVLEHEIGHTLGLRHNFKGSLVPPSTSVMDYLTDADSLQMVKPGAYDRAAISYLYGLSTALPSQPFCTDENTNVDPECNRFDSGADPLVDWYGPNYAAVVKDFLQGSMKPPNTTLNNVLQFVRAGTPARVEQAWSFLLAGIGAPVPASQTSTSYGAYADYLAARAMQRLYLSLPAERGAFSSDVGSRHPVTTDALTELRGELANVDGVRSFATRRQAVDILKKLQSEAGLQALRDGQALAQQQRAASTGTAAVDLDDLLARIQLALTPYYK